MYEVQYTNNNWKDTYSVGFYRTKALAELSVFERKESYRKFNFVRIPEEDWRIVYVP